MPASLLCKFVQTDYPSLVQIGPVIVPVRWSVQQPIIHHYFWPTLLLARGRGPLFVQDLVGGGGGGECYENLGLDGGLEVRYFIAFIKK